MRRANGATTKVAPTSGNVGGPNVWPLNNAPGAVVNLMNPSNIDTVFIAGRVRKWRGNLVGVDVPRVLRLVAEAHDGVVRRSNFTVDLLG
jgi:5-methylthioadenosine/S-adenosylhomocysteine deaminase